MAQATAQPTIAQAAAAQRAAQAQRAAEIQAALGGPTASTPAPAPAPAPAENAVVVNGVALPAGYTLAPATPVAAPAASGKPVVPAKRLAQFAAGRPDSTLWYMWQVNKETFAQFCADYIGPEQTAAFMVAFNKHYQKGS